MSRVRRRAWRSYAVAASAWRHNRRSRLEGGLDLCSLGGRGFARLAARSPRTITRASARSTIIDIRLRSREGLCWFRPARVTALVPLAPQATPCGRNISVGTPLASSGDGSARSRSVDPMHATSFDVRSSSDVLTPHRGDAPGATAPAASDGVCASGITMGCAMVRAATIGRHALRFVRRRQRPISVGRRDAHDHVRSSSDVLAVHRGDARGGSLGCGGRRGGLGRHTRGRAAPQYATIRRRGRNL